jgi:hypothetical protein
MQQIKYTIIGFIVAFGLGVVVVLFSPRTTTDPALTELQEVYTDVVFVGDRTGFCHPNPKYAHAIVGSMTPMPRITRLQSYDKDCTFLDQWIATDKTGEVETGHILCGRSIQEKPPYKFCNVWENF